MIIIALCKVPSSVVKDCYDSFHDSPPKNQRFSFNGRFVAARYEEGCYEKYLFTYSLFREGLSTDDVEVAKGTVFREIRPWACFKTGDFGKEKLGGLP